MKTTLFIITLFMVAPSILWFFFILPIEPVGVSQDTIPQVEAVKYELFRDLLITVISLIALGSVGVFFLVRQGLQAQINSHIARMESLIECRINIITCVTRSRENEKDIEDILDGIGSANNTIPAWLRDNINLAKKVLRTTKKLNKNKDIEIILTAKNNLAYYLALANTEEDRARKLSKEVYKERTEGTSPYSAIDTYVWVLYRFAKTEEEKQKAAKIFFADLYNHKDQILNSKFKERIEKRKQIYEQYYKPL